MVKTVTEILQFQSPGKFLELKTLSMLLLGFILSFSHHVSILIAYLKFNQDIIFFKNKDERYSVIPQVIIFSAYEHFNHQMVLGPNSLIGETEFNQKCRIIDF